jgi:hypothetical protein
MATPGSRSFDHPGILVEIKLVNQIRLQVKACRPWPMALGCGEGTA